MRLMNKTIVGGKNSFVCDSGKINKTQAERKNG